METSKLLGDKPSIQTKDFQEILNEIDMGLSKFDGHNLAAPILSTVNDLVPPSGDSNSPKVQQASVTV